MHFYSFICIVYITYNYKITHYGSKRDEKVMKRRDSMENEFQEKLEPDVERKAQNNEKTRVENNLEIRIENEVGNKTEIAVDLMQKPKIDSDLFFKLIDSSIQGSREYRLISSAFELGVFEALKVPLSAGALADKLGCNPVLMPHFCEALLHPWTS